MNNLEESGHTSLAVRPSFQASRPTDEASEGPHYKISGTADVNSDWARFSLRDIIYGPSGAACDEHASKISRNRSEAGGLGPQEVSSPTEEPR
jgi:hypothetical protein